MESKIGGTMQSVGLLVLRCGAGALLFLMHGWPKVTHYAERASKFANPIGVGPEVSFALVVFAEVVCSALVIVGLATRLASIPVVIFMLVAILIQHADDPWGKKELAVVFLTSFLTLFFTGGGRYSLDALIRGGRGRGSR